MKRITRIVTFYDDGTFTESVPTPGFMPTVPMQPNPYPWPNPINPVNPLDPNPYVQPWPSYPPYTITCVGVNGEKFEQTVGPAFANGAKSE